MSATIQVRTQSRAYDVVIEPGAIDRLGEHVRAVAPHRQSLLVVDQSISGSHGATAAASLRRAAYDASAMSLEAAESSKVIDTVSRVHEAALRHGLERRSPFVALGGGIVGDVVGFAAATWLRGVPLVQCPTTLLAMVDASVGGKTGVNVAHPSGELRKNLVGAFWQPHRVVIDPLVLRTLPQREFVCGLAEAVKHALIAEPALLDEMERSIAAIERRDPQTLTNLIAANVRIKAAIVAADEREERDVRARLNLGHTFAHAFESQTALGLKHGEAVAIGLIAAMHVAQSIELISRTDLTRVAGLLAALGLPVSLPAPAEIARLMSAMRHDKKVQDGRIRLVLPGPIGQAHVRDDASPDAVEAALRAVGAA
jgi:3-dehydroquinate synthase